MPTVSISWDIWIRANMLSKRYADCVDRCDFAPLEHIFSEDAVLTPSRGTPIEGRRNIQKFLSSSLAELRRTIHLVGTPMLNSGATLGTYESWTSLIAQVEGKNDDRSAFYGRYVDTLRLDRATGDLLISKRKIFAQIVEGGSHDRYWLDRGQ